MTLRPDTDWEIPLPVCERCTEADYFADRISDECLPRTFMLNDKYYLVICRTACYTKTPKIIIVYSIGLQPGHCLMFSIKPSSQLGLYVSLYLGTFTKPFTQNCPLD